MNSSERTYYIVAGNRVEAHPYRHSTFESASNEAKRLARAFRGTTFVVFEAVEACMSPEDMITIKFDNIPF